MPIDEARIKLNRAREHIRDFEREFVPFLDGDPYTIRLEKNTEQPGYIARIQINAHPSEQWSLVIGDAIHNLRSSLDYLIWQLSLDYGGAPGREAQFPIFTKPPRGRALDKRIQHLPPEARKVIDSLQPYHGGDRAIHHSLHIISALDNADKHRRLSIVAYGLVLRFKVEDQVFTYPPIWGRFKDGQEFPIITQTLASTGEAVEDDNMLSRVLNAKMDAQAQPVMGITFDNVEETRTFELYPENNLARLFHHVNNRVFPALEPFFKT